MKKKNIFTHPVWWTFVLLFLIHQFFQKILGWSFSWADSFADPFLGMPILLGLLLQERSWARYFFLQKKEPFRFSIFEIIVWVVFFSLLFEVGFPSWSNKFTSDPLDTIGYGLGGGVFYFFINQKF